MSNDRALKLSSLLQEVDSASRPLPEFFLQPNEGRLNRKDASVGTDTTWHWARSLVGVPGSHCSVAPTSRLAANIVYNQPSVSNCATCENKPSPAKVGSNKLRVHIGSVQNRIRQTEFRADQA